MKNKCLKASVLFLTLCVSSRLLIAYLVSTRNPDNQWIAAALLVPAIGFLTIYAKGLRQNPAETFGCELWWNDLRPVHGLLYAAAAVLVLKKSSFAHYPLYLDVLIGVAAFAFIKSP